MTALATTLQREDDAVRTGLREIIPVLVGVMPFGLTIGAAVVASPIGSLAGWLGGPLIAAGSAHLAVVTLVGSGASAAAVILTALVINARLAAYSAILAPVLAPQPRWFRWAAPYLLVDQTFALAMSHREAAPDWLRRYYVAATAALWVVWLGAITTGMLLGPVIPASWQLWFAVPVLFCGMAVPAVTDRPSLVAAAVAGIAALALADLPSGLGVVVAAIAGSVGGALTGDGHRG